MLSGDNSILNQAGNAKTQTDIAQEKEILQTASLSAISKEKYGDLNKDKLDDELDNMIGNEAYDSKNTTKGIKVTFLSGRSYLIDDDGNVEIKETIKLPEGLQVGSVVTYEPVGSTYKWQGKYATRDTITTTTAEDGKIIESTTSDKELDSREGGNARITSWKVFKIDEEEGEVQMVPENPGILTTDVRLGGDAGYINGVKLLNDACSELYSYSNKGITSRSINLEDIESIMDKTIVEAEKAKFTNISTSYSHLNNNNQVNSAYANNRRYPIIYEQENKSVINGYTNTNGLKPSESLSSFIERTEMTGIPTSGIQPYQTYYEITDDTFKSALGSTYENILMHGSYWVASRYIDTRATSCYFYLCDIDSGKMRGTAYSGYSASTYCTYDMFPIVSLNSNLIKKEGSIFKVNL